VSGTGFLKWSEGLRLTLDEHGRGGVIDDGADFLWLRDAQSL